ncbi:MAG TPA: NAD(P)/FAD-dependent oxidoreductase [Candidatus Limnocylindria bacterium]|nr:NAD(P)/FAD-dependent oxidoreductase [Candidatus Limnocylindria bacterium]
MGHSQPWDAIIIGGGIAGLSAAIYLARAKRSTLVIDDGKSLAQWEPDVQNYLGFPKGIAGEELLARGREHASHYGAEFAEEYIEELQRTTANIFHAGGRREPYEARRVLLATGIFHLPPDIPGVAECLGHSMFFCKDCDGVRCEGKRVGIFGWNNEAVEYALGMLLYSPCVFIFSNGHELRWDEQHAQWLREYEIPIYTEKVIGVHHRCGDMQWLELDSEVRVELDALFTARGDIYHNKLARQVGAETKDCEVLVNECMETTERGLYAAGCVTPANCQMIIAAGQGATAAQAINRSLFEESLQTHSLHRYRARQLEHCETEPPVEPATTA